MLNRNKWNHSRHKTKDSFHRKKSTAEDLSIFLTKKMKLSLFFLFFFIMTTFIAMLLSYKMQSKEKERRVSSAAEVLL